MTAGNILFIVFDQIRADVLQGALAAHVPTPNLDRFRSQSVSFDQHCTVTVPCGPARASLLTGLYAMNHRSIRNGVPLASYHATVATEARKAGYEPLLFGYTDTTADPTNRHPNDPDLKTYEGLAAGFREVVEMRFETSLTWRAWLKRQGYELPQPDGEHVDPLFRPRAEGGISAINDPAIYEAQHSDTAFLADKTMEALDVRHGEDWFAHVTFIRPHPPFVAPEPYNRLIDPQSLPAAKPCYLSHDFLDAWFSKTTSRGLFYGFDGDCAGLEDEKVRAIRSVYLGLVAEIDHHFGRLMDWLDTTAQAENTLVIVTGDHGEMLGDKNMWGKDCLFDPACHVPLIIRDPRHKAQAGRQVKALTESVDLAPTLLEWMGLEKQAAMDGTSLCPWLAGDEPGGWRRFQFAELDLSKPGPRQSRFQRYWQLEEEDCNAAMVREGEWKLIHFNGGIAPMLFNLLDDPDEQVNLAETPEGREQVNRLRGLMLDRRMARAYRALTGFRPPK